MTDPTPSETAPVLVIDLQTTMFDGVESPPLHDADALVERVRAIVGWARRGGRKVAFIRHDGDGRMEPGAEGWPVWPALGQAEDEPTFSKSVGDSFSQPLLVEWMTAQAAKDVILLGAQTDECVAATVKGALARGLAVTVVGDAHSTWGWGGETAEQKIARHNAEFAAAGAHVTSTAALTGA